MPSPLTGTRVIDCTQWIQGPMAGVMLADLGADVIKVEDPGTGDGARGWLQSGFGAQTHQVNRNYIFEACNRGKRSITLNLRSDSGRAILYRLVKNADVFVHNWRSQSVALKLAADYDTLAGVNPLLVYSHASGWGSEGPAAEQQAYDLAAEARSGMLHLCREPGNAPTIFPGGVGDIIGSAFAVVGILAALMARQKTGKGQKVETSLLGSLLQVLSLEICSSGVAGEEYPLRSRARMGNPLYSHYRCGDGKWITFSMTQPDKYWASFCRAVGLPDLEKDPRFSDLTTRAKNTMELIGILDGKFAEKPRDEWIRHFESSRADIIFAPLQTIPEVLKDPQVLANAYVANLEHPHYGWVTVQGVPHRFSDTPAVSPRPSPELGQHTEEVLLELGLKWPEITALRDGGAI